MKTTKSKLSAETVGKQDGIFIKGARVHNLKNIDVWIPKNQLVVVTGVSGSGKSSLTIDTLFAEGQRRYAESLSAYARQFIARLDKPDVDYINGIAPAIAIDQKVTTRTTRSTVGSMTEIYDYLRLLFARIGITYSPISGKEVKKDTVTDVVSYIQSLQKDTRVFILIPIQLRFGRDLPAELDVQVQKGFNRLYNTATNSLHRIEDLIAEAQWDLVDEHTYILVDRIITEDFDEAQLHRLADSIQLAFAENDGACYLSVNQKELIYFNNRFEADGQVFLEPDPNLFTFGNPYGACPHCEGLGLILGIDPDLVIPNKNLSVYEDAVACWKGEKLSEWKRAFMKHALQFDFPVHKLIKDLTPREFDILWKGSHPNAPSVMAFFDMVGQNLYKIHYRILQAKYRGKTTCPTCNGSRLRPEATYVKVNHKWIGEVANWQVNDLLLWIKNLELTDYERQIAARLLLEIEQRLQTLVDVGLEYLTLMRLANTLSGGETQRIHLTRFLGSNLTDSLYILDEPSIGLHQKDTKKLIGVLKNLRDLGNTVIVVEHDEMMMKEADYIIDMGPLAAHLGGEVIAAGDWNTILKHPDSLTAKYLSQQLLVGAGPKHTIRKDFVELTACRHHNLKDIDVKIPLGCMTVVMGVSGSGKSTLIADILYPAMLNSIHNETNKTGLFGALNGAVNKIDRVEFVDQNPIGKSSRSNPVTYIKAWDEIRQVLTKTSVAKMNGYLPKHFSFNAEGGRCENCKGEGTVVVEMQFLADVQLECEVCKGQRFKDEILDVKYKEHNVYQILDLTVDEAIKLFDEEKRVVEALLPLQKVGLGYIKLGQSSSNLSGGEAQRVKLATFLTKAEQRTSDRVMFIFDEPTTGLHFHDINKLLNSLNQLIDLGHTVVIIEHNLDVVKCADWVIELGPTGGANGGYLLYQGPYDGLRSAPQSVTAPFLN